MISQGLDLHKSEILNTDDDSKKRKIFHLTSFDLRQVFVLFLCCLPSPTLYACPTFHLLTKGTDKKIRKNKALMLRNSQPTNVITHLKNRHPEVHKQHQEQGKSLNHKQQQQQQLGAQYSKHLIIHGNLERTAQMTSRHFDLEAFSYHPTDGSFAPLVPQLST